MMVCVVSGHADIGQQCISVMGTLFSSCHYLVQSCYHVGLANRSECHFSVRVLSYVTKKCEECRQFQNQMHKTASFPVVRPQYQKENNH